MAPKTGVLSELKQLPKEPKKGLKMMSERDILMRLLTKPWHPDDIPKKEVVAIEDPGPDIISVEEAGRRAELHTRDDDDRGFMARAHASIARGDLPDGVTAASLEDPAAMHEAIAEAVGDYFSGIPEAAVVHATDRDQSPPLTEAARQKHISRENVDRSHYEDGIVTRSAPRWAWDAMDKALSDLDPIGEVEAVLGYHAMIDACENPED